MSLTDTRLLEMAGTRVEDARALIAAERFDAAFYLAGYAIEYGLKAVIAASVPARVFPGKVRFSEVWTHNVGALAKLARLSGPLAARQRAEPDFRWNWRIVSGWTETVRYRPAGSITKIRAESMIEAVADPRAGVLPWLSTFCTAPQ